MSREGNRYRGSSYAGFPDSQTPAQRGKQDRELLQHDRGRPRRRLWRRLAPPIALTVAILAMAGVLHRWRPRRMMDDDSEGLPEGNGREGEADVSEEDVAEQYREVKKPKVEEEQHQDSSRDSTDGIGNELLDRLVMDAAYQASHGMYDGFDRMPKYRLKEPFRKEGGTPYMLSDLIKSSSAGTGDLNSLQLRGCGRVRIFLTRAPDRASKEKRMTWKDFAYKKTHPENDPWADLQHKQSAQQQLPWPKTDPQDRLLVIDSDSIEDITVLKMSRLCQELDADEDLVAVSGEIAGDFTPCKISVEANTLLYGMRDLPIEELGLDPSQGKRCWECDIAPPIFLADPNRLKRAGTWPAKYGPWARLGFFLRNLGKLKIKRCRGMAAFSRPAKLNVQPSPMTYSNLMQLATLFRFHRIFDGGGNVRWIGCARDARTCKQDVPSQPPEEPWQVVCCSHLLHTMLQHLRTSIGGTKARWQLWGHSLLGATRNKDLLPWRADAAVAVEPRALNQVHHGLTARETSNFGTFSVTPQDSSGSFAVLLAVPPPVSFEGAAAGGWKATSDTVLNHPIWTGDQDGDNYEAELKNAIRNHQLKCPDTPLQVTCPLLHSPAVLQITKEPSSHVEVKLQRVATGKDGSGSAGKLPVAQDARALLRSWYGPGWTVSKCDWETSAGQCY